MLKFKFSKFLKSTLSNTIIFLIKLELKFKSFYILKFIFSKELIFFILLKLKSNASKFSNFVPSKIVISFISLLSKFRYFQLLKFRLLNKLASKSSKKQLLVKYSFSNCSN